MPDVLYVHVDDEPELYCLHQDSLLDVRQGQTEAQAVDLTKKCIQIEVVFGAKSKNKNRKILASLPEAQAVDLTNKRENLKKNIYELK